MKINPAKLLDEALLVKVEKGCWDDYFESLVPCGTMYGTYEEEEPRQTAVIINGKAKEEDCEINKKIKKTG